VGVLKYPFYIACVLFAVLTVYSVSTEKPRQFKAKPVDEAATANASKPMAELWNTDDAITSALSPNPANSVNAANKSNSVNPGTQMQFEHQGRPLELQLHPQPYDLDG